METMTGLARISLLFALFATGADAKQVRVTSVLTAPFLEHSEGQYKGYIKDMLDLLEEDMNDTTFTIHTVYDYGSKFDNDSWSGMVGQLTRDEADVAAAPLTVTDERNEVIDFTEPFLNFSLVLLVKKGSPAESFSSVSDLLAGDVEYGALAGGSTEHFFTGATNNSDLDKMWKVMSKHENRVPSTYDGITRVQEKDGQYALVVESVTASYYATKQPCNLVEVDINLNSPKTYALATQKQSSLLPKLNSALRKLKESGELDKLRETHWKDECSTSNSSQPPGAQATLLAITSFVILLSHYYQQ